MKNNNNKTNGKKSKDAVKAYKPKWNEIKSDTGGSYTGIPEQGEQPVQDVDDL